MLGFLAIECNSVPNTNPTPIATPAKHTTGMALAKYLNPNKIIGPHILEKISQSN
jgi:hypothetical protein